MKIIGQVFFSLLWLVTDKSYKYACSASDLIHVDIRSDLRLHGHVVLIINARHYKFKKFVSKFYYFVS